MYDSLDLYKYYYPAHAEEQALQAAVQRIDGYVRTLEEKVETATKKK
jgi:hypothetical protein